MKKPIFLVLFLIVLGVVLFFFFYKPKDADCDEQAKQETKNEFYQKNAYERFYEECLKQKE